MDPTYPERVAQAVQRRRTELGLPVTALSAAALIPNSTLDIKLKTGEFKSSELARIATALGTTVSELVRDAEAAA